MWHQFADGESQASSVLRAFVGQRKFVLITTKSKKPDMSASIFMQLLKPLQECIGPIHQIRDANHGSKVFNHLSCVSESIEVLAWVTVDTKPYKHVEESLGSAQYWGNRVLKEYKERYGCFSCYASVTPNHSVVILCKSNGYDPTTACLEVSPNTSSKPFLKAYPGTPKVLRPKRP